MDTILKRHHKLHELPQYFSKTNSNKSSKLILINRLNFENLLRHRRIEVSKSIQ